MVLWWIFIIWINTYNQVTYLLHWRSLIFLASAIFCRAPDLFLPYSWLIRCFRAGTSVYCRYNHNSSWLSAISTCIPTNHHYSILRKCSWIFCRVELAHFSMKLCRWSCCTSHPKITQSYSYFILCCYCLQGIILSHMSWGFAK